MLECRLVSCPDGYFLIFDKDGFENYWHKITEEEAELISEKMNVEIEEIPF